MSEGCDHEVDALALFDPEREDGAALRRHGDASEAGGPRCLRGVAPCEKCGQRIGFIYDLRQTVEVDDA
jgi:hypothetical protein